MVFQGPSHRVTAFVSHTRCVIVAHATWVLGEDPVSAGAASVCCAARAHTLDLRVQCIYTPACVLRKGLSQELAALETHL